MLTAMIAISAMGGPISTKSIIDESWTRTLVVGHRGAAAYKPENTIPSFEEAIASGANATECDVYTTKDKGIVVIHDKTLDRTTSLKGPVKDFTKSELKAAGIPMLEDYTKATQGKIVSVIEIKDGEGVVEGVVEHVRKEKMLGETIIFSFNAEFVKLAKELEPKLYTVWLNGRPTDLDAHFAKVKEIKADSIGVSFFGATPEIVQAAHARKMPIFVWTVPPGPEVDRLKSLKVNFIITDHPRDVREQLAK